MPSAHSIKCGKCQDRHRSVEGIQRCHQGFTVGSCPDQFYINEWDEDGQQVIRTCGADAWSDRWGSYCTVGHNYPSLETQSREGRFLVADEDEAYLMRRNGYEALSMRGEAI